MTERLTIAFPGLHSSPFRITSPIDDSYNCIAWAAGDDKRWWWPIDTGCPSFWPSQAAAEESIEAFLAAFQILGYSVCENEAHEVGFEKVAIFAKPDGIPTHAARQQSNGLWTSKLGRSFDIEHELKAVEGEIYGAVAVVLKRSAVNPQTP